MRHYHESRFTPLVAALGLGALALVVVMGLAGCWGTRPDITPTTSPTKITTPEKARDTVQFVQAAAEKNAIIIQKLNVIGTDWHQLQAKYPPMANDPVAIDIANNLAGVTTTAAAQTVDLKNGGASAAAVVVSSTNDAAAKVKADADAAKAKKALADAEQASLRKWGTVFIIGGILLSVLVLAAGVIPVVGPFIAKYVGGFGLPLGIGLVVAGIVVVNLGLHFELASWVVFGIAGACGLIYAATHGLIAKLFNLSSTVRATAEVAAVNSARLDVHAAKISEITTPTTPTSPKAGA